MIEEQSELTQGHAVARVDEISPGARKLVEVAGKSLGIFNVHGTYVAVLNICPHAYAPICQGRVGGTTLPSSPGEFKWGREGEMLFCPWHGWEFDLLTGRTLVDKRRLRRYRVYSEDGMIYVDLNSKLA